MISALLSLALSVSAIIELHVTEIFPLEENIVGCYSTDHCCQFAVAKWITIEPDKYPTIESLPVESYDVVRFYDNLPAFHFGCRDTRREVPAGEYTAIGYWFLQCPIDSVYIWVWTKSKKDGTWAYKGLCSYDLKDKEPQESTCCTGPRDHLFFNIFAKMVKRVPLRRSIEDAKEVKSQAVGTTTQCIDIQPQQLSFMPGLMQCASRGQKC